MNSGQSYWPDNRPLIGEPMNELTPVIPALFRCPSCNATGIRHEYHDYADEPLGCPDCQGQGIYNVEYAFKIGRLVDRVTIDYQAGVKFVLDNPATTQIFTVSEYEQVVEKQVRAIVDAALGVDDED